VAVREVGGVRAMTRAILWLGANTCSADYTSQSTTYQAQEVWNQSREGMRRRTFEAHISTILFVYSVGNAT
jgi:hypothetical protein